MTLGLGALSTYFGGLFLLNAQVAFFGAVLVFFVNFRLYKKRLELSLGNEALLERIRALDESEDEEAEKETEKVRKTLRRAGAWQAFSPWKLLAYLVLALAVLILNKKGLLNIFAFVFGILWAQVWAILSARSFNVE